MSKKNEGQIILYQTDNGKVSVDVRFEDETFWITQKVMGELFDVESHTITYHLQEIFKSEELEESATTRKIRAVRKEGNRNVERELQYYNLDAIIAVRRNVLVGKGKVSKEDAFKKAGDIYAQSRVRQDEAYISEFDRDMAKYLKGENGGGSDE